MICKEINPFHIHICSGVKGLGKQLDHLIHSYPCYNKNCKMGEKRYCGIIIDSMISRPGMLKKLIKEYV